MDKLKAEGVRTMEYVKEELINQGVEIGDTDEGKVTLVVNLTLNEKHR